MKDHFRIHVPNLLHEIALLNPNGGGVMKIPLNIFRIYLAKVAERAIQIDDPELNILMLEMALYEVDVYNIRDEIRKQKKRIPSKVIVSDPNHPIKAYESQPNAMPDWAEDLYTDGAGNCFSDADSGL